MNIHTYAYIHTHTISHTHTHLLNVLPLPIERGASLFRLVELLLYTSNVALNFVRFCLSNSQKSPRD